MAEGVVGHKERLFAPLGGIEPGLARAKIGQSRQAPFHFYFFHPAAGIRQIP